MKTELIFLLTLGSFRFLRTAEKLLLADILENERDLLRLTKTDLGRIVGRHLRIKAWEPGKALRKAEKIARFLEGGGAGALSYWDAEYPQQLRELYNPPFLLFYRGRLPAWDRPAVAVVGTRRPTGKAADAAFALGLECALNGCPVVSGLARGIDQAAHRGTLECGGTTISVLGCGIDMVYPGEHKVLAEGILRTGGVIFSEYPPGTSPTRYNFPERNRIISGLSRGVVVVQAPVKSGALITADYALDQGRDLFVHAAGLDGTAGEGCRLLAEDGAAVVSSGIDVLIEWNQPAENRLTAKERGCAPAGAQGPAGIELARELAMELDGELYYGFGGSCYTKTAAVEAPG